MVAGSIPAAPTRWFRVLADPSDRLRHSRNASRGDDPPSPPTGRLRRLWGRENWPFVATPVATRTVAARRGSR
ncbi:hypothetical protein FMEAI12_2670012 [Parafrankia sp. Ea1.12]|nr:hypothetical protein FMEAI12_2670012 [Parafrankia sp. Ea1.12]